MDCRLRREMLTLVAAWEYLVLEAHSRAPDMLFMGKLME
jgi:hypothetical protein